MTAYCLASSSQVGTLSCLLFDVTTPTSILVHFQVEIVMSLYFLRSWSA